jgi:hypothetical protein
MYGDELDLDLYFEDFKRTILGCVADRLRSRG